MLKIAVVLALGAFLIIALATSTALAFLTLETSNPFRAAGYGATFLLATAFLTLLTALWWWAIFTLVRR